MTAITLDFSNSPTIAEAIPNLATVMGIMGPVGSGKSHGCAAKLMWHAGRQVVQKDGWIKSRYAIIRNTGPELKSTTIKTFTQIFPEGPHGRVVYSAPITYRMKFPPKPGAPGMDIEVIFLALDNENDVKKLLSLELTGAWGNEARELHKAVIDVLIGRCGRYPSMQDGGCVDPMVWLDTNPPDEESWWFEDFETSKEAITFRDANGKIHDLSYKIFKQPPAVLELREMSNGEFESIEEGFDYVYDREEVIPAAGTYWGINPEAENLANLGPAYYAKLLVNKSRQYIKVYCQGRYGYVRTGKAVVPEFNAELQVCDIPVMDNVPLQLGIDIGGGTLAPAAVIGQVHPLTGTKLIHDELCANEMGVDLFATSLKLYLADKFPGREVIATWTDPAAEQRDQVFVVKINEYLRAAGFTVRSASTNDPMIRRQAIADPCSRLVMGKPGLLIHPRAKMLVSGLKGKWDFKKMKTSGNAEIYSPTPSKNAYSHPCDALGYFCLGTGEAQPMRNGRTEAQKTKFGQGFQAKDQIL